MVCWGIFTLLANSETVISPRSCLRFSAKATTYLFSIRIFYAIRCILIDITPNGVIYFLCTDINTAPYYISRENGEGAFLRRFAFPLFSAGRTIAFKKALPRESFFPFQPPSEFDKQSQKLGERVIVVKIFEEQRIFKEVADPSAGIRESTASTAHTAIAVLRNPTANPSSPLTADATDQELTTFVKIFSTINSSSLATINTAIPDTSSPINCEATAPPRPPAWYRAQGR